MSNITRPNQPSTNQHPGTRSCDGGMCFAMWRLENRTLQFVSKGCWVSSNDDCKVSRCTNNSPPTMRGLYFCCCSGNMCNQNVTDLHVNKTTPKPESTTVETGDVNNTDVAPGHGTPVIRYHIDPLYRQRTIIIVLVSLCGLTLIIIITYLTFRICGNRRYGDSYRGYCTPAIASSSDFSFNDLTLNRLLCHGRFSEVWQGTLKGQEVAAKVFTSYNHKYYANERDIYTLPFMDHDNLLAYHGSTERVTINPQYIITLTYCAHGSLTTYLRGNTIDFTTLCRMCHGIASGLAHLHTDIWKHDKRKPVICHRDLNSRNILVQNNLSCVISDFGFSLETCGSKVIHSGRTESGHQSYLSDVGTLRYMAPEVLDGAVNLRDCETSLKQVDVYALSLVMWEIATQCSDIYLPETPVPDYRLPYDSLTPPHPTFEDMKSIVCREKLRPPFPNSWINSHMVMVLRETIEECWDPDGEARLTALCVQKRVGEITHMWTTGMSYSGSGNDCDTDDHDSTKNHDLSVSFPEKVVPMNTCPTTPLLSPLQIVPPNTKLQPHPCRSRDGCSDLGDKNVAISLDIIGNSTPTTTNNLTSLNPDMNHMVLSVNVKNCAENTETPGGKPGKLSRIKNRLNLGLSRVVGALKPKSNVSESPGVDGSVYIGLESASPSDATTNDDVFTCDKIDVVNEIGKPHDGTGTLTERLLLQSSKTSSECETLSYDILGGDEKIGDGSTKRRRVISDDSISDVVQDDGKNTAGNTGHTDGNVGHCMDGNMGRLMDGTMGRYTDETTGHFMGKTTGRTDGNTGHFTDGTTGQINGITGEISDGITDDVMDDNTPSMDINLDDLQDDFAQFADFTNTDFTVSSTNLKRFAGFEYNQSQDGSTSDVLSSVGSDYERIKTIDSDSMSLDNFCSDSGQNANPESDDLDEIRLRFDSARLTDSLRSFSNSSCVESVNSSDSQYSPRSSIQCPASYTEVLKRRLGSDDKLDKREKLDKHDKLERNISTKSEKTDYCDYAKPVSTRLSLRNDRVMCTKVGNSDVCSPVAANSVDI